MSNYAATSSDFSIVSILMRHRQSGDSEDDFSKRAIISLVKRLRNKKDQLDYLSTALATHGAESINCVTLQRTLDGRLQIAGKKIYPHVMYAKIWRWPDLHKHELKHVPHCQFPYDLKYDYICINPYHYYREVATSELALQCVGPNGLRLEDSVGEGTPGATGIGVDIHGRSDVGGEKNKTTYHASFPAAIPSNTQQPQQTLTSGDYRNGGVDCAGGFISRLPAPAYWCSVGYFEYDTQVGETYKVSSRYPSVTVDGYVDLLADNRFCLGALSNVQRRDKSESVLLHIGKGVVLDLQGEGDVWLRCESNYGVFVQSYYLDVNAGRAPGDAVHKIHPSTYIKVFDLRQSYLHMRWLAVTSQAAVADSRLYGTPITESNRAAADIGVDDYRRICKLRLSFVKGWGPDYPRKDINECPCWIEVDLHRALQIMDEVLPDVH